MLLLQISTVEDCDHVGSSVNDHMTNLTTTIGLYAIITLWSLVNVRYLITYVT